MYSTILYTVIYYYTADYQTGLGTKPLNTKYDLEKEERDKWMPGKNQQMSHMQGEILTSFSQILPQILQVINPHKRVP